ncbi:DUF5134 domain-containing protein [Streptomyces sp. NPDC003691]
MHGPAPAGWLLVALSAAAGGYCLARMRSCAGGARRAVGGEALMGFGMAVMAVPAAALDPPPRAWAAGAVVFGGAALLSLLSLAAARRGGHHLHHAVGSLAMVYMAVLMADPSGGGHPGGHAPASPAGIPVLTGALLAYYTVYVLRSGARLAPAAGPGPQPAAGASPEPVPELVPACRLAMGLGMLAMLLAL